MTTLKSALPQFAIHNKRVLLRTDFNVPLHHETVVNDYRLRATLPTIKHCIERGARLIIATHIGRPSGYDESLSTKALIPWFESNNLPVHLIQDPSHARAASKEHSIVLLENLRFFVQEKNGDPAFAQLLASQAEYYVQDAFACLHRADTSIALVPEYFAPDKRTIGFLVEKEVATLNQLMESPVQPFVLILGGGKIKDKIPLILNLLSVAHTIILGPALANTFLHVQGINMGASPIDHSSLETVRTIMKLITEQHKELLLPTDLVVGHNGLKGSLRTARIDGLGISDYAVTIGPETMARIEQKIHTAGTVFYNGLMGTLDRPETLQGVNAIFKAMAHASGFTVIAGGDSVAAAQNAGFAASIKYLSTGGGATLAYLSGSPLPGLQPFLM